jgi:hypothetical protein
MSNLTAWTSPVVAPSAVTSLNRVPYLSVSDFRNAPTGIDLTSLLPSGGTNVQQDVAIAQKIAQASGAIDSHTMGRMGTLCASQNQEGPVVVRVIPSGPQAGMVPLICAYKPILEVDAVSLGTPGCLTATTPQQAVGLYIRETIIYFPAFIPGPGVQSTFPGNYGAWGAGWGPLQAQWLYVNGYPHSPLAASVAAGAEAVELESTLGCYTGTPMTIYDGQYTEEIQVATVSGKILTLAYPLEFNHTPPSLPNEIYVSALPADIREACILWTTGLIKERGSDGMVLAGYEPPAATHRTTAGSGGSVTDVDIEMAKDLLRHYRVVNKQKN